MRVEQIMSRVVQSCGQSETLNRPAQIMWEHDIGCVPVVDGEGQVVGMLTDRDIAMAAYLQGRALDSIWASEVMARHIHVCHADEPVTVAEERMQRYQVRRLPVTDATGILVGVISMNDIALEAAREKNNRRPEVRLDEVALTLAQVCQHRGAEAITVA